jgi:deoxyuridine 5'-triphosphate nucleotidohydrolase
MRGTKLHDMTEHTRGSAVIDKIRPPSISRRAQHLSLQLSTISIISPNPPPVFLLFTLFSTLLHQTTPLAMSTSPTALLIKRLTPEATIPIRGSPHSAGLDLSASIACIIPAGGRGIVKTGLSIACPASTYARIAPRSGLAVKKFIDVGAGVVDSDYRGEVGVVLFNFGAEPFPVEVGDRVAQLIIEQIVMSEVVEVEELSDTVRGSGGYGSTGVSEGEAEAKKPKL